jgi:hypothetical protein
MLVYGDRSETADPAAVLASLREALAGLAAAPPGIARHSRLVAGLIEAGRLQQGVADTDFEACGVDRRSEPSERLGRLVYDLARAACRSWEGAPGIDLPAVPAPDGLPPTVEMRTVEGYAFYAVYPEAYAEAARRLRLSGPPCVIGIRSIGTSLAAVAAAALGAPQPVTVRPVGHPFARRLALAPELAAEILRPGAHYVVVDEGPGLSGSSFGAVADWLEGEGVPRDRIAFLPSHGGAPGGEASAAHRARWAEIQRIPGDFGPRLGALAAAWLEEAIGALDGPLEEISGGGWRRHVYADPADWPAADPQGERRKFLARSGGETWLVKFAGLGQAGAAKLARARALHAAGLAPELLASVNGFLVERWHGDAPRGRPPLDAVVRYLAARASLFPARPEQGASLGQLLEMSRRNIGLALGDAAARALDRWEPLLPGLAERVSSVETDNRLDLHKWVEAAPGRWLKTDALDHHAAHDLVGCQDIAWDVAGAVVELDLGEDEAARLRGAADPGLTAFYRIAYPAFRLGEATLAARRMGHDPDEKARLEAKAAGYIRRIRHALAAI